jgi:hypothetical protein
VAQFELVAGAGTVTVPFLTCAGAGRPFLVDTRGDEMLELVKIDLAGGDSVRQWPVEAQVV